MKKYEIIYADPPWQYTSKENLQPKAIINGKINTHYPSLSTAQLKSINIPDICDDNCLLFLWVVSPMLDDGIDVLKSWGFKYSTVGFVWYKHHPNAGYYTLSSCEICLIGKRGNIPKPRGQLNARQFLPGLKTEHSAKPDEIRYRIMRMFPTQKRLELFARKRHWGWDAFGNELEYNDVEIDIG